MGGACSQAGRVNTVIRTTVHIIRRPPGQAYYAVVRENAISPARMEGALTGSMLTQETAVPEVFLAVCWHKHGTRRALDSWANPDSSVHAKVCALNDTHSNIVGYRTNLM